MYLLAILYKLSPDTTWYSITVSSWSGILVVVGIFNIWPILKVFDVRLFNLFSSSTVVLNLLEIEYRLSPRCTVYVSGVIVADGIFNNCPTFSVFDVKLFNSFNSFTVVLNLVAILYKLSPDTTA